MAKYKVVITDDRFNSCREEKEVLSSIDVELIVANCSTPEDVIKACKDADGVLVNLAPMPAEVIEKLDKCKIIARYGVGYDNVDVKTCTKRGIWVSNVTGYCNEEVSDHALALMLACARKVARRDKQVRAGQWNIGRKDPVYRLAGKTFAFLGFGMIARCLHRKIKGFDFSRIMVCDPFVDEETIKSVGAEKVGWETALREADFISIHMPLNDSTSGKIDSDAFDMMKSGAVLVNTSRGPIIDENSLIEALKSGKINSAGLDVHTKEPLDKDSELMEIENCVLTDHTGFYSEESVKELKTGAAENVKAVLTGGEPKYPVNKI